MVAAVDVHDGQCGAAESVWQPSTDLRDSLTVATRPAWRLPWGCWLCLAAIAVATTVAADLFGSHRSTWRPIYVLQIGSHQSTWRPIYVWQPL